MHFVKIESSFVDSIMTSVGVVVVRMGGGAGGVGGGGGDSHGSCGHARQKFRNGIFPVNTSDLSGKGEGTGVGWVMRRGYEHFAHIPCLCLHMLSCLPRSCHCLVQSSSHHVI